MFGPPCSDLTIADSAAVVPVPAIDANRPRYGVPCGGMFRYVSCANYFGEVAEWAGYALAARTLAGTAFALATAANLIPRALAHHAWYRSHLPGYPPGRRAVIPFLL